MSQEIRSAKSRHEDSERNCKEVVQMNETEDKKGCEHPERLQGKPGECSPEQIRECHGDAKEHSCVSEK